MCNDCECGTQLEAQAWLWQHKVLLAVISVLLVAGLVLSGNGL